MARIAWLRSNGLYAEIGGFSGMSTERGNVTFIVGGFNLSNNTRWNCKYQSVIRENVQRNGENTSIGRNRNRFRFREIIERTDFMLDR